MTQLDAMTAPVAAPTAREATGEDAIRPFRAHVPDADLADMRRRLAATRWPDKETVADQSQGVQSATVQALARSGRPSTTGVRVKRD